MSTSALLALADGTLFEGQSIGISGSSTGEVIFNTSMTGYQEILTDPSYAGQIITFTYPHIGNVGVNELDIESDRIWASGMIISDLSPITSNWRSTQSLSDYLTAHNIVAISNIDTRKLTRILRDKGAQNACLCAGENLDATQALAKARAFSGLNGLDLAKEVTTEKSYSWEQGTAYPSKAAISSQKTKTQKIFHVVAYDFGVKQNSLRLLVDRGCKITVVPAQTTAAEVLALKPDGVFLSNGPGDPAACDYAIQAIQQLIEKNIPIFGICLGFQLLALACGAKTIKMKFGHHGGNHPIKCIDSGKVLITSQNHGFCVDDKTLPQQLRVTHRSLFDGTLQGIKHINKPVFALQGHPEASPGPHDMLDTFDNFILLISEQNPNY